MSWGLGSSFDKGKGIAFDLNFEPEDNDEEVPQTYKICPICHEPLSNDVENRSTVTLSCLHEYHLDCIGAEFNAKQKMQCPVCRTIGPGHWLYANGLPNPDRVADIFPSGMPSLGIPVTSLFGPSGPRQVIPRPSHSHGTETNWSSSFGRNHFGENGMTTNPPNEYNGLMSIDAYALRRNLLIRENYDLRHQVEHTLALLDSNERDQDFLESIRYGGGVSSLTEARGGSEGNNNGGSGTGGNDNGGSGSGGSGIGGRCMNCGRSG